MNRIFSNQATHTIKCIVAIIVIGIAMGTLLILTKLGNIVQSPDKVNFTFVPVTPHLATKAGSSDPSTDEWPMFHGQLNHTGTTNTSVVRGSAPFWSHATGGEIESSPRSWGVACMLEATITTCIA